MQIKSLNFGNNQCVKIETKEQYNSISHLLRSGKGIDRELKSPVYLEWANSVSRGTSLGIIHEPRGTWSGAPLTIVELNQAAEYDNL